MNKLLKLLSILFVLSLVVLSLIGCTPPWESGMVLNLKVDTPQDGTTVTTSTVMVSGRVTGSQSAVAKVRINDTDSPLKDGKYSTDVTLTEGKNVINIVATAEMANIKKQVTVTSVPAKQ